MRIELNEAAARLLSFDEILILIHHFPDGDTLGCGYALCRALQKMGKQVRVECCDEVSSRFGYITSAVKEPDFDFEPNYIVAVDVADEKLLGSLEEKYGGKIDLCIDHHASNTDYAVETYVDSTAGAACEIIFELIRKMGEKIDVKIAAALYTGIATDTGCFKFSNTTARTHMIAAELIKTGIHYDEINRIMFDTKSKARIKVEQAVLENMEYHHFDKVALTVITRELIDSAKAEDSELDGITSLPRQIEGVVVGITLREKRDGRWKVSVRTHAPISASKLCAAFGGGGHDRAAGCEFGVPLDEAKSALIEKAEQMLTDANI